jgi:hypothetical protein
MIHGFGAKPPETRAFFGDTLTAGGGWTSPPPGWGSAREQEGRRAQ